MHPLWRWIIVTVVAPVSLVLLAAILAHQIGGGIERSLIVFFISLTAVAGIGLYSGNSGILSFGHLSFMAIAAYTSAILTLPVAMKKLTLPNLPALLADAQLSFWMALIVALLVVFVVALIIGLIISRLEGSTATIATLALLIIVHGVIIGARDITRGSQSFFGVPRETDIWVAAIICALALIIARWFRDSNTGLKLRAARDDALAARASAIGIRRERLLAWLLSALLVALAGVALGHFLGAFSPKKFYFVDTFALLAMLIVGGMSTVSGAVLGAVVITLMSEILRRLEGGIELFGLQLPEVFGMTQIGIGLLILLVMFKRPDGLAGIDEWDEKLFGSARRLTHKVKPPGSASLSDSGPAIKEPLIADTLSKQFSGLTAVDNVSLRLEPGEIVGLIGPNGSGKTTLINLLSGILTPSAGQIRKGETVISALPAQRVAELGIARTFQNIRLFHTLSVAQNVSVAALNAKRRDHNDKDTIEHNVDSALEWMGISDKAQLKANTLSYGDQRRVEIARALALRPDYLFLDEPAAGMNQVETDALLQILQQVRDTLGIGILIVDHDLALITRLCERIIVLNEGRLIAQGSPAEVQQHPAVIAAYLGNKHQLQH